MFAFIVSFCLLFSLLSGSYLHSGVHVKIRIKLKGIHTSAAHFYGNLRPIFVALWVICIGSARAQESWIFLGNASKALKRHTDIKGDLRQSTHELLSSREGSWRQERPSCAPALYPKRSCCLISTGFTQKPYSLSGIILDFFGQVGTKSKSLISYITPPGNLNSFLKHNEMEIHVKILLSYSYLLKRWSNSLLIQNQMSLALRSFPLHSAIESSHQQSLPNCPRGSLREARVVKLEFPLEQTQRCFQRCRVWKMNFLHQLFSVHCCFPSCKSRENKKGHQSKILAGSYAV